MILVTCYIKYNTIDLIKEMMIRLNIILSTTIADWEYIQIGTKNHEISFVLKCSPVASFYLVIKWIGF